ncbi:MAG: hypothetical protein CMJ25_21125 [Phycisphaerae bacterium]|nr:hypothetical protein [Phycisphaerae bacterium]|tara:strand:- start:519 stop:2255 length:1737 start_codon:yes stop_codon:yes gene_type:complete
MTYFKLDRFSGIAPGVSPRLLAEQFGQISENIDFASGAIEPITTDSASIQTLQSGSKKSIYYYRDASWLEWTEDYIHALEGPIPGDSTDRLYWTGQGTGAGAYPRMGTAANIVSGVSGYPANSFRLGVPSPAVAPAVTIVGTADDTQSPFDVSYVYTLVTSNGEEGPPSLASTPVQLTDAQTTTVSTPTPTSASGNFAFGTGALKRLYRSNTGSNSTQFQFVAEDVFTETSIDDTRNGDELGEILPSTYWIGPPDDDTSLYPDGPLQGLTNLANGIFAGFTGNRLCLSEPYLPHAWPINYRITLAEDIVAIASVSNGVICLTNGRPYLVTGTDASAMSATQLDIAQACVNKHSVVDMGDYVLYASPDGLVAASGSDNQVVTEGLISVKQWNDDFKPLQIKAFKHENTYVAFYTDGSNYGGWVFDPRASEAAISTLSRSSELRGAYMNHDDGELYFIEGTSIKKYRGGSSNKTATWKSKKFLAPKPISMSWVSVKAEAYPVTVKVYADGSLISNYTVSYSSNVYTQATTTPSGISNATLAEPIMRLPAVIGKEWEIEVSGAGVINEACIAQSMDEIQQS